MKDNVVSLHLPTRETLRRLMVRTRKTGSNDYVSVYLQEGSDIFLLVSMAIRPNGRIITPRFLDLAPVSAEKVQELLEDAGVRHVPL